MSKDIKRPDKSRRRFITNATTVIGAIGVGGTSIPFISYMNPSARAKSAGAPIKIDISKLELGKQITVEWRGQPIWALRRTEENLSDIRKEVHDYDLVDPLSDNTNQQPAYARNIYRSIKPEYLIVIGICTHLGCIPTYRPEKSPEDLGSKWDGGYFCPCHGSRFDLAGRVYKYVPAPTNLVIPPHQYLTEFVVEVGTEQA